MSFASNQVLQISGDIRHDGEIKNALEFAIKASGWLEPFTRTKDPVKCVYQITDNGQYCIGWSPRNEPQKGWLNFQFDFDLEIISKIIAQHLEKQTIEYDDNCLAGWDGSYHKGFLMEVVPVMLSSEYNGIKEPFYGIVSFKPYTCFYGK